MTISELAQQSSQLTHVYKITPEVYDGFQRCSNDYNPLHTDEAFAQEKGFGRCVMYGNILNAFISHFVGMLLPTRSVMILSQSINFHKPVFLHDEIRLQTKIGTISESAGLIEYKFKFHRTDDTGNKQLVAKGYVQVGLLEKN